MSDSPSPPPHNRLNVMMFSRRIARQIVSIDYETEDSECDYEESECERVADSELESESSENEYRRSLNLRKRRKLVEEKEKEDTMLVPKKGRTDTTMVQEGKQHETNPRRRKLVKEKEKEDTMLVPNKKRTDTTIVQERKQKEATKNIRTHKKCTASSASSVKKRRIRKLKKCEVCGTKQLNIWRHMKSKHSGEKEKKTKEKKRNNSTEQFITEENMYVASPLNMYVASPLNMYVASPLNEQNIAWSEDEDKEEDVPTQERMYEKAVQKHKRRSFTPADGAQLVRLCEENIRSGNVRRMNIMMTLTTSEEGRLLILRLKDDFVGKDFWKIITDRIHYERRRRQNK